MRNIRFTPLLILSFILLLLSLGVMGNWAYKLFFKTKEIYTGELIVLKPIDSLNSTEPVSETKALSNKIIKKGKTEHSTGKNLAAVQEQQFSMNSTQSYSTATLPDKGTKDEIYKLKAEIAALLNNNTDDSDLKLAKQKIEELEQRINKLVDKNSNVERENERLIAVLRKFSDNRISTDQNAKAWPAVFENNSGAVKKTGKPVQETFAPVSNKSYRTTGTGSNKINTENPVVTAAAGNSILSIDEMNLKTYMITDNKELETYQAYQVDKWVGSVTVKNISNPENNGEIYIVVLQPDGRVLQKSTWESGTFQSAEGKKVYSCRLRFDIAKGEAKKLTFSLNAANGMKGIYIMQVYNKKGMIGKFSKLLS